MIKQLAIENFQPNDTHTIWDVRDLENYQAGHIEYAQHQPLDGLSKELLDNTEGDIYVLCGGGAKAEKAVQLLESLDPSRNIIHLTGGTRGAIACGMNIISETGE